MNTNELKQAFIKRMIQKIENEINLTLNSLNSESDKREFKRNNEFNKAQLEKYLNEYLTDRHVQLMKKGESVFNNIAINAFNSYIAKRNKELTKLPKNNPYSDLEDSNVEGNGYKETNRWLKQVLRYRNEKVSFATLHGDFLLVRLDKPNSDKYFMFFS